MLHSGRATVWVVSFSDLSENSFTFTVHSFKDFHCWHHWNEHLALTTSDQRFGYSNLTMNIEEQFWWKQAFKSTVSRAAGHCVLTCFDSCSCWLWFVVCGDVPTLSWIAWHSMHQKDTLSWSQMHQQLAIAFTFTLT